MLVFAAWLALSYATGAWTTAVGYVMAFVALFALAPVVAARWSKPLAGLAARAEYAAPVLLFVFAVIARIEPAAGAPLRLFAPMFALLALIAWRALAAGRFPLYFIAAFFGVAAEASWSATHLTAEHLRAAVLLYAAFGIFYLGVPLVARRLRRAIVPAWGGGAVLIASLFLLLFLASGARPEASLWGLAVLLAILDAGIFVESASGGLPALYPSAAGCRRIDARGVVAERGGRGRAVAVAAVPRRHDADDARRPRVGASQVAHTSRGQPHRAVPRRHLPRSDQGARLSSSSPSIGSGQRRRGRSSARWPCSRSRSAPRRWP